MSAMIKVTKFGSNASILKARGDEPISLEQIAHHAPAVFAEGKHDSRSERYQFIPTREVLTGLIDEGFEPFEVRQGGSRIEGKREFTKHMIRFRHRGSDAALIGGKDRLTPEVALLNAHDGTSKYRLFAGAFRWICANGLMSGEMFEDVKVPHKGDVQGKVIDAAFRVVSQFPALTDAANEMAGTELNVREQLAFARAAATLRWEPDAETGTATAPIDASRLLAPRRPEDNTPTVWTTFNRVQENLIRGGQGYTRTTRDESGRTRLQHRHVSEVRGIDQDRQLNRALWTLAQEMDAIKHAA